MPRFLLPHIFSLPETPTYPLLPSYRPFHSLLNQSGGSLGRVTSLQCKRLSRNTMERWTGEVSKLDCGCKWGLKDQQMVLWNPNAPQSDQIRCRAACYILKVFRIPGDRNEVNRFYCFSVQARTFGWTLKYCSRATCGRVGSGNFEGNSDTHGGPLRARSNTDL